MPKFKRPISNTRTVIATIRVVMEIDETDLDKTIDADEAVVEAVAAQLSTKTDFDHEHITEIWELVNGHVSYVKHPAHKKV